MIEITIKSINADNNEIIVYNNYFCDSIETALAKIHSMCNTSTISNAKLCSVAKDDDKVGEITFTANTLNSEGLVEYITYFYINAAKILTINDIYNNDI